LRHARRSDFLEIPRAPSPPSSCGLEKRKEPLFNNIKGTVH
jgi:hypothetical protein